MIAIENVASAGDRQLWFGQVKSSAELRTPLQDAAFLALIFVADQSMSSNDRAEIASVLISSGCRYAVCAGSGCDAWHDAIDVAALGTDPPRTAKDVMTASLPNESLEDLVEFFLQTATFEGFQPNYLVLQVGETPQLKAELLTIVKARFLRG
ncbi:MAG: hypothetical protein M3082_19175 [Candidatus Dormibacteraeota bacterium]|nr:hypothetical protein [Candidatus Dormibacteraeota bacterium]